MAFELQLLQIESQCHSLSLHEMMKMRVHGLAVLHGVPDPELNEIGMLRIPILIWILVMSIGHDPDPNVAVLRLLYQDVPGIHAFAVALHPLRAESTSFPSFHGCLCDGVWIIRGRHQVLGDGVEDWSDKIKQQTSC